MPDSADRQNAVERQKAAERLYAAVGARLRRARLERRLSQEEVAESAGTTAAFLGQIERGERRPSLLTFVQLARALREPVGSLVDEPPDGAASRSMDGRLQALLDGASPKKRELAFRMLRLILRRRG